jgi:hypothetical protein
MRTIYVQNGFVVNIVEEPAYVSPYRMADGTYVTADPGGTNVGDAFDATVILTAIVENDPLLKALFKELFRLSNEVRSLRTEVNKLATPDPYTAAQAAQVTAQQYRDSIKTQF